MIGGIEGPQRPRRVEPVEPSAKLVDDLRSRESAPKHTEGTQTAPEQSTVANQNTDTVEISEQARELFNKLQRKNDSENELNPEEEAEE